MRKQHKESAELSAALAENALLGRLIDELQKQQPKESDSAMTKKMRETEDALLDMHQECQLMRTALREKDAALVATQRDRAQLQQAVRMQAATEAVLVAEIAGAEAAFDDEKRRSHAFSQGGEEAIRGMRIAEKECRWLHEQMQTATGGSSSARGGGAGSMPAMRTAYVRAVQRCHELQLHSARTAEAEAALRPELARACERIAALQGEVNALRVAQAARTTRAPAVAIEAPSSAKAAPPAPAATTSSSTTPSGLATLQPGHSRLNATPAAASEGGFVSPPLRTHELGFNRPIRSGGASWCGSVKMVAEADAPPPPRSTRSGPGNSGSAGRMSLGGAGTPGSAGTGQPVRDSPRCGHGGAPSASGAVSETAALRGELSRAHAQIGELERLLERRQVEHQSDLEALGTAQREAAASQRTLLSERAWVAELDEMRIDDIATIQTLETRLEQWRLA